MRLSDLDVRGNEPDVLILQTPSSLLNIFLEDKMKLKYHIISESIIDVENKSHYKKIKDIVGIVPPFSRKWFVKINLDKFKDKELINIMKESTTCFFFCTCSKYSTFKDVKEKLKNLKVVDLYINYLRKPDFVYLYDSLTLSDNKLDNKLFNYVIQSYSGDVESVLELFKRMNQGEKFTSRKEIADVCGIGGNSIESFLFTILKPISGSDKGLKTVIKNRMNAGVDLGNTLGWNTFYNFLASSIERFCELKMLSISGVVYKQVRNLPDSFDEVKLARYQKYLWRLRDIPMSDFLRVRQCMGNRSWRKDTEFIEFIYRLYSVKAIEKLDEVI